MQYRRTLSGKRVPADQPRPTWQDLVHVTPPPAAAPVVVEETARDRKNRLARERRAAAKMVASAA